MKKRFFIEIQQGSNNKEVRKSIDDKEDIESAAKRELKEETGITSIEIIKKSEKEFIYDLPNELLGKIWDGKYKGQKQTWFLIKFTGSQSEINIKQKKAEFYDWRWTDPLVIIIIRRRYASVETLGNILK